MSLLIVVSDMDDWPHRLPGVSVVTARTYLTDPAYAGDTPVRVVNLCRDTAYQSHGYYVSLLADARGHAALPKTCAIPQPCSSRAARGRFGTQAKTPRLAILHDPACRHAPSNRAALGKFVEAAHRFGMQAQLLTPAQTHALHGFDALFIRDTTNVNHYTYRIAHAAQAAGMVVLDDPGSIVRCTNKIYLYELLARHRLPMPETMVVHPDNLDRIASTLGLPCVLKQPDGAFSQGVARVESDAQLRIQAARMLETSKLVLAQEYLPTAFDWRIGILDGRVLFACKYHMAPGHWQVIKHDPLHTREGRTEALPVDDVPELVLQTALAAARLIGDGFYGVDLKQIGSRVCVIEINDNPNVDAGNEDAVLADALYGEVMDVFRRRIGMLRGLGTR